MTWQKYKLNLRNSHLLEKFDSMLSPVIDSTLGQRCSSIFGYQFSEIVRSLMSVYFLNSATL